MDYEELTEFQPKKKTKKQMLLWLAKRTWHYATAPFRWYAWLYKGKPWYVKILSAVVSFFLFIILYLGAVDIDFLGLFGKSPSMDDIKSMRPAQASEMYSADSVMIGKIFSENRTPVKYKDVNPVFWKALIDTEDVRFYNHHGVDVAAVFAALKDYVVHSDARGASTITQQLAKNLFRVRTEYSTGLLGKIPGMRMLVMKSKEWVTSLKLEWNFSKEEILTMYANTVDFGSNSYGIKTACKTYFGITPKELRVEQAAVLVGMLKATTTYNPRINPENSLKRRNVVLSNMLEHGHLTRAEHDSLCQLPIELNYSVEKAYDGQANYFRRALLDHMQKWFKEHKIDPYTDGLKIYTTIDTRLQKHAEEAVWEQMKEIQKNFYQHWGNQNPWQDARYREIPNFIENIARRQPIYKYLQHKYPDNPDSVWHYMNKPHDVELFSYDGKITRKMSTMDSLRYITRFMHCGFLAMEPHTGHIKAWVGDVDFNTWKYDKVTSGRQPGSTFKLFVYTEAMNQGMTPCKPYVDKSYHIGNWTPHNASGGVSGASMPLRTAFAKSLNTIAAQLGQDVGIEHVARTAHAMGIKSKLQELPSLALGASNVNLLEMVNSYCTVANDGLAFDPVFVTRILDRDGNEIYRAKDKGREAIPYRSAFFMQQMLKGGLAGTSHALKQFVGKHDDTEFGGKTGTSNNNADGWFIGISPKMVCGAWVGGEYRVIHFRTGALGQGGKTALPVCGRFLKSVLDDERFSCYHAKFEPCRDPEIEAAQWECYGGGVKLDSIPWFSLEDLNNLDDDEFVVNEQQKTDDEPDDAPVVPKDPPADANINHDNNEQQ